MTPINFKKWNTILGWIVFAFALITYSLTVEPTISFWDCSEYIATSAKLEIGHPPGAPLFQMLGAFFAMFATSADKIALMVNMMSVFSSAFTILFMFWSLTLLMKRLFIKNNTDNNTLKMVLGSSFIASLAFTFTDSFWFNAVEAEVYAMASLLIAVLLWLGLRWEQDMDKPKGNKWLLIISLVVGLSFGVHFMALLTIPSIGFLYYFKKYKNITPKSFILANIVIIAVLLFIFKLLLPYTLAFFGKTEIFMVNSLGLPFNSGTIFAFVVIIALFYFGLNYTRKKGHVFYNTIILSILFVLIGFSTWFMLPIRANANPPINENKPSDAAEVLAYYNREQYGEQKLFFGPQFSHAYSGLDENNPYLDEKPNYERDYNTGKYIITNNFKNAKQNTDDNHKGFLPRMWSDDHSVNYMSFTEPLDFRIKSEYSDAQELVDIVAQFRTAFNSGRLDLEDYDSFLKSYGEYLVVEKPSFANNMKFMFEYQFGYMYWRYLMWNFVGRQSDIQWKGDHLNGNWISGIEPLDAIRLGNQSQLTSDMKNNKGRNTYFFLPFILGVIGMIFHARKDLKSFYVLLVLFLFTGIALKIYLNERPFEPRERDYALVGSFYVFAMWIGFGIYGIYEGLKKYLQPKVAVPVVLTISMLAAPVLMAKENWDDHNRSKKYTALAMAKAYLDSCEENAILFTIGDNDTFPLWYAQEVEHYRTDVRIVNTSLFMTDWYIDQMKRKAYESDPVPISFTHEQYRGSNRDYSFLIEKTKDSITLDNLIQFMSLDDERAKIELRSGQSVNYFPTDKIVIPIDKERIIKNKVVAPKYYDSIVPMIQFKIKKDALYKNRLMMLDIINQNNWKRPVYFTGGSFGEEDYLWMKDYLELDGLCFKLVPIKTAQKGRPNPMEMGFIDSDKNYAIFKNLDWGNSGSPEIYHDPETRRNGITYRTNLARLMETLINEGKNEKAKEIIEIAMEKMPIDYFEYYTLVEPFAEGSYEIGKKDEARSILSHLIRKYQEELTYYNSLSNRDQNEYVYEISSSIERYRSLLEIMKKQGDLDFYNQEKVKFNNYNKMFLRFGRDME
ncbi:protein O-mannosyl-transferase family [Flavobacterium chuncheonense]|uniref:Protein O-mannosyl-transferase family n=1 Tax=Flavobacterium chuncheonense TaxID=2026653 RepID=A0ABW5YN51_9FLAO